MTSGMGLKGAQLSVKAEDGPRDQRFLLEKTGVVEQEPGREIVASVETKVVVPDRFAYIIGGDALRINPNVHFRIQRFERPLAGIDLEQPDVRGSVEDLTLKIIFTYHIEFGNT